MQHRPITAVWTNVENFREGQVPTGQISTTSVWIRPFPPLSGVLVPIFVRNAGCKIIPGLGYRTLTFLHINQFQTFRTATLTRLYRQASVAFLTVFSPHTITMSAGPKFTLNSGFEIPAIGLGKSKQMGVRRATIHFDFI